MTLHENEIPVDESLVRALLRQQRPEWADRPLRRAGSGTENTMYRLGDDLLVRVPRSEDRAGSIVKEQRWLPRLAPLLTWTVPEVVHAGTPSRGFPGAWSVHRWVEGDVVGPDSVQDWGALGADLASFVGELHDVATAGMTTREQAGLSGYRGGSLRPCDEWISKDLAACRTAIGHELDVDTLARLWRQALTLPDPTAARVWLHGDLKPTNLLARKGRLHAIIDFGTLSIGFPDAEHAPIWDLNAQARQAYWDAMSLDEATWTRARAWAIAVGVSGIPYYRYTYPAFVAECRARLAEILADAAAR